MAESWWLNNVGQAARVTTPTGGVPQYGLAAAIGTADGWDSKAFSTWAQDQAAKKTAVQAAQATVDAHREDLLSKYGSYNPFSNENNESVKEFGHNVAFLGKHLFGALYREVDKLGGSDLWDTNRQDLEAAGIDKDTWDKFSDEGRLQAISDIKVGKVLSTPGVKQALGVLATGYEYGTNALETPLMMVRRAKRGQNPLDFQAAWKAAEDNTPTESLLDSFMWWYSDSDLDRIKRTNNFYQITQFSGDLALSFYADPAVIAGKSLGTAASISKGYLPRAGTLGERGALEVLQSTNPSSVAYHGGVRRRVGMWRGQKAAATFPQLREAAQSMDITDFQNLPMFRKNAAVNGGAAAYAFHYAAGDDRLWDLTRRAVVGDAAAWREIRAMKEGQQEILGKYQGADPQTYIDALDATKFAHKQLQSELDDLTKTLNDQIGQPLRDGSHFRTYDWSLDRARADKEADLADVTARLERYEDYRAWLDNVPALSKDDQGLVNPALLGQISAKPALLNDLSRRTYRPSPYGAAHTIHSITKSGFVKQAGLIDLKRQASGTESIMRYFEGLRHDLNYVDRDGLNEALDKYGKAYDEQGRWDVVREIEDKHLPKALATYFGLKEDTVLAFMDKLREKQDLMVRTLAGDGAVYSTAPSLLESDSVKLLKRDDEYSHLQIVDGRRKIQLKVPNEALEIRNERAIDPTQTPKFYQPLSSREIKLAMRHDADLFKELEGPFKNRSREVMGFMMEDIDKYGARWNRFWKPFQLFRLGWPQRVLMDESLRAMVVLGMGPWLKEYAFRSYPTTALNAINPAVHPGPFGPMLRRRALKAGPGPITYEDSGRFYDVPSEEELAQFAPGTLERYKPVINKVRAANLDAHLVDDSKSGWKYALNRYNSKPGVHVFDPINGTQSRAGWGVPVASQVIPADAAAIKEFVRSQRNLLAAGRYRMVMEPAENGVKVSVVRTFSAGDEVNATNFAFHADQGEVLRLKDGQKFQLEDVDPSYKARQQEVKDARDRATIAANMNVQEREFGMGELDFSSWDKDAKKLLRQRSAGSGHMTLTSGDGEKIRVPRATEGAGEIYQSLLSSAPAYSRLTDTFKRTLSKYRTKAVGYKRLQPPDVSEAALRTNQGYNKAREYYVAWSDVLNHQIRYSPIWFKMLEGKSNQEIVDWLVKTPEGAAERRKLPHMGQHPELWVEEHRWELDNYLPNKDMQRALARKPVMPTDLRRIAPEDMPVVAAEDLEILNGTGIGAIWGQTAEKIYHALGTVPTDVLNRQPFFNGMYNLKMKNLIAAHKGPVTNDDIAAYSKLAREFGLAQVRRTMFDLMNDSNLTQALRFTAPFFGAQFEALEKWGRMMVERPEVLARFYLGLDQIYDRLMVTDEDGKPVKLDPKRGVFGYAANDRIVLQIPNNLKKIPPFDKMLAEFGSVDFTFGSLNTALQGENFLMPSLGPVVSVPANLAANMMWDTHGVEHDENWLYKWLFPVGRPNGDIMSQVIDQVSPGWAKRATAWSKGTDSRSYLGTYFSVYRELEYDHKKKGLPEPTPEEVKRAVDWHMGLRVAGAFALPVQLNFRPKHQFFLDEYHKMIQDYGPGEAFDRFVKKYGADAAYFAASQSSSVGVPATAKGMSEWSQHKELVQKYPDWADAIISPDAWADDFSSDAYGAQFDIKLGPGTKKTLRESYSPEERKRVTDVRVGWLEFRQMASAIDAELYARGLNSVESKQAADLKQVKTQFVADLVARNPNWAADYNTFDNTIDQRVKQLGEIVARPEFDNRPDMQGVRQYLIIRKQVTDALDYLYAHGGSRNLQNTEEPINTQLRNYFYSQVGSLVQANPSFGEFYNRWLTTDRLEKGSG